MKTYSTVFVLVFSFLWSHSQSLVGAWEGKISVDSDHLRGDFRAIWVFSDTYFSLSLNEEKTNQFILTKGGSWDLKGNQLFLNFEFDSKEPEKAGSFETVEIDFSGKQLKIEDSSLPYKRIDDGTPGALNGAWLMSGRKRNGEFQTRDTDRPRKTMKILSGTRFQWIAYNIETKQFMGTGGGTYTTIDGKYTENIEFFSRDNSRVGASLEFNFELKEGDWHHSGFSSKGDPLYEVWSLRK